MKEEKGRPEDDLVEFKRCLKSSFNQANHTKNRKRYKN